jgi:uncharacterized protein
VARVLDSILIKPAGPDCNLECTYCFYRCKAGLFPAGSPHRMGDDVLAALVRQMARSKAPIVHFAWQGGEPTLMGLRFFERALVLQHHFSAGRGAANSLQTNGLLIDGGWADFLARHRFLVGLSLDGPPHVHDRYRRLGNGEGSWEHAAASARMMLAAGVQVNALSVVTDHASRFPDEIYAFHRELGLRHLQFIPCLEPDSRNPSVAAPYSVTPERLADFLCRVFDLWLQDFRDGRPTTSVRFFDSLFYRYVGREPPDCTLLETCGPYLVVEHNGDVYPCDFYVDPEWRLGNVLTGDLLELFHDPRHVRFANRKAILPEECRACRWLALCRGGCPRQRGLPHSTTAGDGAPQRSGFCAAYQRFFSHADPTLRMLAQRWNHL